MASSKVTGPRPSDDQPKKEVQVSGNWRQACSRQSSYSMRISLSSVRIRKWLVATDHQRVNKDPLSTRIMDY